MTKLVIQIPAYNEAETLPLALADLPRQIDGVDEIQVVVIDDGSTDNTAQVALANGADYVIRHRQNRGLSRAFMDGIQFSLALGADIIVNTDADNQYPGGDIPELIQPILAKTHDLVIGDRQLAKNLHFSPFKRLLERVGTAFVRRISSTNVPDAASGFRAFSRYAALPLQVYNPYSYTLDTLIQAGKSRLNIASVPIHTNPTTRASRLHKGMAHFIWRQGGAIVRSYLLYQPLRSFMISGILVGLPGLALIIRFLVYYFMGDGRRFVQSVTLGGAMMIASLLLVIIGFLADATRANRQLLEETLIRKRDTLRFEPDLSQQFLGLDLLRKKD
ncbi:MAG: glycosyltransferase family 2 protein [Chloroflexi bacterium]|nr:glycosyltransferase family 2 protein [Chloroflexota bacterium]